MRVVRSASVSCARLAAVDPPPRGGKARPPRAKLGGAIDKVEEAERKILAATI
jgi:hypothetical protein